MKISAAIALWMCVVFTLFCMGFAIRGFTSLDGLDAIEREHSVGYAWFWTFLALVSVVFGVLSRMISKGKFGDVD